MIRSRQTPRHQELLRMRIAPFSKLSVRAAIVSQTLGIVLFTIGELELVLLTWGLH